MFEGLAQHRKVISKLIQCLVDKGILHENEVMVAIL
jgi:hypothetical protein